MFGQLADIIGRKKSIYIGLLTSVISVNALTFASDIYSFVVIYFLIGTVALSTVMGAIVKCVELVGSSKRVWMATIIAMIVSLGGLALILLTYLLKDWQQTQLCIGVPTVVYVCYLCIFPEQSRWLLSNGKREDAIHILAKLIKCNQNIYQRKHFIRLKLTKDIKKVNYGSFFSYKNDGLQDYSIIYQLVCRKLGLLWSDT